MKTEPKDEPRSGSLDALVGPAAPEWTYSAYRASLYRKGKPFAIITPDGKRALAEDDINTLLAALNGPTTFISEMQHKQ